jgi:putative transposase
MKATLDECRWLYNHFLEARKNAWEEGQESHRLYDQLGTLPVLKAERPSLATAHSQVLQNVGVRIDLAFKAFIHRILALGLLAMGLHGAGLRSWEAAGL